ncbi:MAG: tail fiber protein [Anaerocolumna sp.]
MDWYIGLIQLFESEQANCMLCDGRQLPILQYRALFELIGITYGGDNRTYFMLPNLIGAEPDQNLRYYIVFNGIYPFRNNKIL